MLPAEIPGLGKTDDAPTLVPAANVGSLTPEDYFVLSRIDGTTSVRQIVQLMGGMLPEQKTVDILKKLKTLGAIRLGAIHVAGHSPTPTPATGTPRTSPAAGTPPRSASATTRPLEPPQGEAKAPIRGPASMPPRTPLATARAIPGVVPPTTPVEFEAAPKFRESTTSPGTLIDLPPVALDPALLAESCDLDDDQKRRILHLHVLLPMITHFELLGVTSDGDKKDIKRNYFKLSKEFHPDRFYNRQLGSYRERLHAIFTRLTHAFETLSDDGRRAAYALSLKARRR